MVTQLDCGSGLVLKLRTKRRPGELNLKVEEQNCFNMFPSSFQYVPLPLPALGTVETIPVGSARWILQCFV